MMASATSSRMAQTQMVMDLSQREMVYGTVEDYSRQKEVDFEKDLGLKAMLEVAGRPSERIMRTAQTMTVDFEPARIVDRIALTELMTHAETELAKAVLFEPAYIVGTRPVSELWAHIVNCKCPSWGLICRAITTLFLAVFACRWHLYDNLFIVRPEIMLHNLDKNIEKIKSTGRTPSTNPQSDLTTPHYTKTDLEKLNKDYPHLLECAHYYKLADNLKPDAEQRQQSFVKLEEVAKNTFVDVPDFSSYTEITPDTIRQHFLYAYLFKITDKDKDNSIKDIINSAKLVLDKAPEYLTKELNSNAPTA